MILTRREASFAVMIFEWLMRIYAEPKKIKKLKEEILLERSYKNIMPEVPFATQRAAHRCLIAAKYKELGR